MSVTLALLGGAAALGLGSSILGGAMSSKAAREASEKAKKYHDQQQRENQSWYDRRYYENPTMRADAQRVLNMTAEKMRERNRAAAGTAAVMGGGAQEALAATKEANNEAMADAVGRIAAAGEARKDAIEEQYMNRKQALDSQQVQTEIAEEQQKSKAIAEAVKGVGAAASSFGAGVAGLGGAGEAAKEVAAGGVVNPLLGNNWTL